MHLQQDFFDSFEMSTILNSCAYQLHKYATGFGKWDPEVFMRAMLRGVSACIFLNECLETAVEERVSFSKLNLLHVFRPARQLLEGSRPGGLVELRQEAQVTVSLLVALYDRVACGEKCKESGNFQQAQIFLDTVAHTYLQVSTETLLRAGHYV